MTLSIDIFTVDKLTNKITFLEDEPSKKLGGFKSSRLDFWGADIMKSLGLTLLPSLAYANIDVLEDKELKALENEAHIVLKNSDLILQHVPYDEYFITFHIGNLLYAIGRAKEVGGGVLIG